MALQRVKEKGGFRGESGNEDGKDGRWASLNSTDSVESSTNLSSPTPPMDGPILDEDEEDEVVLTAEEAAFVPVIDYLNEEGIAADTIMQVC